MTLPKSNYYHVKECLQGAERPLIGVDAYKNLLVSICNNITNA